MKQYPSILHDIYLNRYAYAFDKLDGSNVRFEWSKKGGWYKFGTRRTMIREDDPLFGKAINIFMDKYGEDLERVFRNNKLYRNTNNFIVYGEFFGENSFAGQHKEGDKMDVVLFDVNQYKKGFIKPNEFIKNFGHLHIPELIYQGNITETFIKSIRNNEYDLVEGVVVKGTRPSKNADHIWMSKIKTTEWLEAVRKKFGEKALIEEFKGSNIML